MELTIEAYSKYAMEALKNTMDEIAERVKDYPAEMDAEDVLHEVIDGIATTISVKDAMLLIYAYDGDVITELKEEYGDKTHSFNAMAYFVMWNTIRYNH